MQIPILIEPLEDGRFRAKAGEPFAASADGLTAEEAAQRLEAMVRDRLNSGSLLSVIDLGNGTAPTPTAGLQLEPLPDNDWFFHTMREAIAENRQREDEAEE
jgi:hypothetical protein